MSTLWIAFQLSFCVGSFIYFAFASELELNVTVGSCIEKLFTELHGKISEDMKIDLIVKHLTAQFAPSCHPRWSKTQPRLRSRRRHHHLQSGPNPPHLLRKRTPRLRHN